jgi:hypothetical protein
MEDLSKYILTTHLKLLILLCAAKSLSKKDKLFAAHIPGFCCGPIPHQEGIMLSTIETHPAGKLLVIFLRKYEGKLLLDCRRGDQTLPKHSRLVAFVQLMPEEDERRITWLPEWGWAPCGHPLYHPDEEQCYCGASRVYRLVNSDLNNRVEEYDWRDAVRRLVEERFQDEYQRLLNETPCQHCNSTDCQGDCEEPEAEYVPTRVTGSDEYGVWE